MGSNPILSATLLRAARLESLQSGRVTSTKAHLAVALKACVSVETETNARQLGRWFRAGSCKAFASKQFLANSVPLTIRDVIYLI